MFTVYCDDYIISDKTLLYCSAENDSFAKICRIIQQEWEKISGSRILTQNTLTWGKELCNVAAW